MIMPGHKFRFKSSSSFDKCDSENPTIKNFFPGQTFLIDKLISVSLNVAYKDFLFWFMTLSALEKN